MNTREIFCSIVDMLHAHRLDDYRYRAKCPVHQGKSDSSLSIKLAGVGTQGRILLFCHARCEFRDIVQALGYEPGDMFAHGARPSPRQRQVQSALRGLSIWRENTLIIVTQLLRSMDALIQEAEWRIHASDEDDAAWGILAQALKYRDKYEPVFQILNRGGQQETISLWRELSK